MADGRMVHRPANVYILMLLTVLVCACQPPGQHLWFYGETKMTKTYKTGLLDNRVQLEVRCSSFPMYRFNQWDLGLSLKVWRSDPNLPIAINPDGVVVLVDSLRMEPHKAWPTPRLDTLSDRKFTLSRSLYLQADIAELRRRGEIPVRIVLDSLLTLNGEPVHIDTVRALETQTCR